MRGLKYKKNCRNLNQQVQWHRFISVFTLHFWTNNQSIRKRKRAEHQQLPANAKLRSNKYLQKLNKNDFYGIIRIRKNHQQFSTYRTLQRQRRTHWRIKRCIEDNNVYVGSVCYFSNYDFETQQDYPLIFDAPTSSFGGFKGNPHSTMW